MDKFHSLSSILLLVIDALLLRLTRQKLIDLVDLHLLRIITEALGLCRVQGIVFSYIIPLELILLTLFHESLILIENSWQIIRAFLQSCTKLIVTYYHVLQTRRTIDGESTYFLSVIRCLFFALTLLSLLFLLIVASIHFIISHTFRALLSFHNLAIIDSLFFYIKVTFVVQQSKIDRIFILVILVLKVTIYLE